MNGSFRFTLSTHVNISVYLLWMAFLKSLHFNQTPIIWCIVHFSQIKQNKRFFISTHFILIWKRSSLSQHTSKDLFNLLIYCWSFVVSNFCFSFFFFLFFHRVFFKFCSVVCIVFYRRIDRSRSRGKILTWETSVSAQIRQKVSIYNDDWNIFPHLKWRRSKKKNIVNFVFGRICFYFFHSISLSTRFDVFVKCVLQKNITKEKKKKKSDFFLFFFSCFSISFFFFVLFSKN